MLRKCTRKLDTAFKKVSRKVHKRCRAMGFQREEFLKRRLDGRNTPSQKYDPFCVRRAEGTLKGCLVVAPESWPCVGMGRTSCTKIAEHLSNCTLKWTNLAAEHCLTWNQNRRVLTKATWLLTYNCSNRPKSTANSPKLTILPRDSQQCAN